MINIYIPAMIEAAVIPAIKKGEWYFSPTAAAADADQYSFEIGLPFKVFKVTIEEYTGD